MNCTFCGSKDHIDKGMKICKTCLNSFEQTLVPAINFKDFFSSGLEKKLKEVDSLLFSLPENFFLWYLKGHLEHELGESKKALRSINTSISYKEDFGDSWIRLGLIYSDMHREGDARENFQRGLRYPLLDPSNLVDAGSSLIASDQPELASSILQRSLELLPEDDRAMVGLAKTYVQTGEMEKARELMDGAIELYPHNEEVLRSMAQIMMRMDDLEAAMDMYSRILDQHPRDFEALLAKGEIHLRSGQLAQSLKSYRAVRDLDIHISWNGILKFIISTLSDLIENNRNQPSYREDLRKEYENLRLFLSELDGRVDTTQSPEVLDQIENLIKVIENVRISLKENIDQFDDLLSTYKVEDSFHKHLSRKVADLKQYHRDRRYYDGKQISLELTPFLSDLKTMDSRTEARLKKDILERLKEMENVGIGVNELVEKYDEVENQEKNGNLEGATFLLKEIQMSLDEQWNTKGRKYFNSKMSEIEDLLEKGREKFDVSRLRKKFEMFSEQFPKGPKAVRESYLDLTKTYAEDSENYYRMIVERDLREIEYKIVILEKDGKDTRSRKRQLKKLQKKFEEGETPYDLHQEVSVLLDKITEMELKLKVSDIRDRLMELDELLGDVDALGMDEEIAKNVEPVRRVIERSLKNENFRLADILTGEVYDNVEKLLSDNYLDDLRDSMEDSENEIARLGKLGVDNKNWNTSLTMVKKALDSVEPDVKYIPVVTSLAELQTMIQDFYVEQLSTEIENRIGSIIDLTKEGEGYGFDLDWDKKVTEDLEKRSEEISSLEILEEAVSINAELEIKIKEYLGERIRESITEIQTEVDSITEEGGTQKDVMGIVTCINKAEVLLENEKEREAFKSVNEAQDLIDEVRKETIDRNIEFLTNNIKDIISSGEKATIDLSGYLKKVQKLNSRKKMKGRERMDALECLRDDIWDVYNKEVLSIFEEYENISEDLISRSKKLLPEKEVSKIRSRIKDLELAIRDENLDKIPEELKKTGNMLDKMTVKVTESAYLSRCSQMIENLFSMDDDRAKDLIKKAQKLAESIKGGKTKDIEKKMNKLQGEATQLRSLMLMQNIETMLSEIDDLDDLARELFEEIEGEDFEKDMGSISKRIKGLMDSTSKLYDDPDTDTVKGMADSIEIAREDIIDLENKWRAKKRLQSLEEMGVYKIEINDKLLQKDLLDLKILFEKGDHIKFFRVYERINSQMDKLKRQLMMLSPGSGDDHGREVLVRGKGPRKPESRMMKETKPGMAGIQRLARDMGEKRKLLDKVSKDTGPEEEKDDIKTATELPPNEPDAPEEQMTGKEPEEKKDLSGMARLIAGDRIKKLEEKGSSSLTDEGRNGENNRSLPWSKDKDLEIEGLDIIVDEIEGLDDGSKAEGAKINAENTRKKLDEFYGKLPENLQLDESMTHYGRGVAYLQRKDYGSSLREFRIAISSAVKITKLHKEITKAIVSIDKELARRRKLGKDDNKMSKIFGKAEEALKQGRLTDCATLIKVLKKELYE